MKQIRLYQIITALCCLLLISCGIDRNLKKGEKFLSLGEYYDAADQFKQAYTKTPAKELDNRGKIALKMARCYEKINRYTPSEDQSNKSGNKGKKVGIAYQLENGEIIYVPEDK